MKKGKNYRIGTFDIETDPFKKGRRILEPFAADFFDGERHFTFWGPHCMERVTEVMLEFPGIIYAHNGGKFDFHFLLPHLDDNLRMFCIDSRIASLVCRKTEFRDSYLIIPVGLAKFGNKLEIDYNKLERENREANKEEIIKYLQQDNTGLYEGVKEFIARFGMSLTLAGASFKTLAKRFEIKPVTYKDNKNDLNFRPYYYGGRCQVFRPGITEGDLSYIDINSAYPRAMMEKHPFGKSYLRHCNLKMAESRLQRSFIHFRGISAGVLPERKEDGGIHFPNDGRERDFYCTGWEFVSGRKRGKIHVAKLYSILTATDLRDFKPFVEHFYKEKSEAKREGRAADELFAKLMLNSSYGKFALNPDKYREHKLSEIGEEFDPNEHWQWVKDFDESGFSLYERPAQGIKLWYNIATAASITGWVRAFLSESLDAVSNPIYCDTDSIICENTGGLVLGPGLGDWKVEAEGVRVFVGGKKIYAFEEKGGKWKKASKGVNLSIDEIKRVCMGEVVEWESEAPNFTIKASTVQFVKRKIRLTTQ